MMPMSLAALSELVTRPKIFVSYHRGNDKHYFDALSNLLHDTHRVVSDCSVDEEIDSADPDYVRRRISEEFITGTSCTFVLCGAHTYQRKYVDWEIKATLDKQHALIGVHLPRFSVAPAVVPWRLHDNHVSGYAVMAHWDQLVTNPRLVPALVAEASSKDRFRIVNSREMMSRNAIV
jgi:hypothetical protein